VLPDGVDDLKNYKNIFAFQRSLLWHIAVIGQPVSVDVLETMPMLREFYTPAAGSASDFKRTKFQNFIRAGISLLEQRCLIFRLYPRATEAEKPDSEDKKKRFRYAMHSQMQRHIFRTMHAPFIEFATADQFAVTLFVSQPNDVPRLTRQAYRDLHRTVAAMIGYPEAESAPGLAPSWPAMPAIEGPPSSTQVALDPKIEITLKQRSELLHAALGIMRSVYSLSTAARAELVPSMEQSRQLDVIATESIKRLNLSDSETGTETNAEAEEKKVPRPFYAEDIVWLYNECGVLSYAQGRMPESIGLFERANEAATKIEPDESGAIRTRVALNRVMADIDRGRLAAAEATLLRIIDIKDEHRAITCIANGLLGLVEHLRGRFDTAGTRYRAALEDGKDGSKGLITLQKSRAASIISRGYGDLYRTLRDHKSARDMLRQSLTLAIEGGHEDIRHQAQLANLRLTLAEAKVGGHAALTPIGTQMHAELDVIEDYARIMGMPRLQCEAYAIRTELHQYGGDLKGAASVASQGLTLAATHDLRLRKTRFLLRLAEIYDARGQTEECRPLVMAAFDLAREIDYHSAREQGQKLYARIALQSS
jgi:tetratricopeptide (TPR) repeat protein